MLQHVVKLIVKDVLCPQILAKKKKHIERRLAKTDLDTAALGSRALPKYTKINFVLPLLALRCSQYLCVGSRPALLSMLQ
jgi:hypothetical protein